MLDAALDEQKLIADVVASIRAAGAARDALIQERAAEKLAEQDTRAIAAISRDRLNELPPALTAPE